MTRSTLTVAAALALLTLASAVETRAQPAPPPAAPAAPAVTTSTIGANLNISPKRVTFDRNRRTATVYIYNQGGAPATFDIALVDRAMLPDGQIVTVEDAQKEAAQKPVADKVMSAQSMLAISPRRANLAPGKGQTIRLRVSGGDATVKGEFRTHLTITTIPPPDTGLTAEQAASTAPDELRFQINSVFGVSIPAIVRLGDIDVRAGIENMRIEYANVSLDGVAPAKRTAIVAFDLVRVGTNSLFGNIDIRAAGRRGEQLGIARGVGVYTEIGRRTLRMPLNRAPGSGEKLEITFSDDDTSPGKVLAKFTQP